MKNLKHFQNLDSVQPFILSETLFKTLSKGFGRQPAFLDLSQCDTSPSVRPSRFFIIFCFLLFKKIKIKKTIEVLDTYCSTSSLITVSVIDVISGGKKTENLLHCNRCHVWKKTWKFIAGVEDAGEPAVSSVPADFWKLNIGDCSWRLFTQAPKKNLIESRLILSE